MEDALLTIDGVTKRYGDLEAVSDVSLEIEPGEIFALLGPNGAGKTTLIGCITGLVTGFEGDIDVAGFDVIDDYRVTRRLVGLVPQELNYDAFFNVRDVLEIQGGYFGVKPDSGRVDELLDTFALEDKADANTRWLSGGMKRRLMICKALVHDPVLLFLDEPTAGVDVELREELWEYVRGLRDRGTTIVLTTHYIEEAEKLADRIGILHKGALRRVAPRDELMEEFGRHTLNVATTDALPDTILEHERLADLDIERSGDRRLLVDFTQGDEERTADRIVRTLIEQGATIASITSEQSSLEEVFREVIQNEEANDEDDRQEGPRR